MNNKVTNKNMTETKGKIAFLSFSPLITISLGNNNLKLSNDVKIKNDTNDIIIKQKQNQ